MHICGTRGRWVDKITISHKIHFTLKSCKILLSSSYFISFTNSFEILHSVWDQYSYALKKIAEEFCKWNISYLGELYIMDDFVRFKFKMYFGQIGNIVTSPGTHLTNLEYIIQILQDYVLF